jgi:threonine aldolase
MRQAGIIASAGIVALEQMVERLSEDHDNARHLAEGLVDVEGLSLGDPEKVRTNIVYMDLPSGISSQEAVRKLENAGVRVLAAGPHRLRAVTHYQITAGHVDKALAIFHKIFAGSTP